MRDIAGRVFRRTGLVRLLKPQGQERLGRGIITRQKGQAGNGAAGEGHWLGRLEKPLYAFTGELDGAQAGDILEQEGLRYRVLQAGSVALGRTRVCARLALEREGIADDGV